MPVYTLCAGYHEDRSFVYMDSIASFHLVTGGHYITMQPADWTIPTSQ